MKTKFSLLLLIGVNLLLNSGCEKVVEKPVVEESELNFRNDKYYPVNSNTPYTGRIVSYYENGQLKRSGNCKDGQDDGLYESYYENGLLRYSENYKDGEKDGLCKFYYKNGQLRSSENFKYGEKDGVSEFYHEHGQLKYSSNWKDGELVWVKRYENGQLKHQGS
tara:strand:- start:161 stop:652 length:492 start_codon:yes stop_codon:yes gene_type:complete